MFARISAALFGLMLVPTLAFASCRGGYCSTGSASGKYLMMGAAGAVLLYGLVRLITDWADSNSRHDATPGDP